MQISEHLIEELLMTSRGIAWDKGITASEAETVRHNMRIKLEAALSTDAEPVAWYWEDATGCFHITLDRPDVKQMAAVVGCEPKPLYAAPPAPSVAVKALRDLVEDLEMRARNGVVDCSHGIYCAAKDALSAQVQDVAGLLDDTWNTAVERAAAIADDCVHLTPDPGAAIRTMLNARAMLAAAPAAKQGEAE